MRAFLLAAAILAVARPGLADEDAAPFHASRALHDWVAQQIGADMPQRRDPKAEQSLLDELDHAADRAAAVRFFARFAQYHLDRMNGDGWVCELLGGPLHDEVQALGADLYPKQVHLVQIATRDGKVLTGSVQSLTWVFSWMDNPSPLKGIGDQFVLTLGRGTPGMSYGLWVDADSLVSRKEVDVPSPALFVGEIRATEREPDGRLTLHVLACRPPEGPKEETVVLEPRYVESGGALFVEEALHLEFWMRPDYSPEGRAWYAQAHRRSEKDQPEADLRTGQLCLDLRFLDPAYAFLTKAKEQARTATAATRALQEWGPLRTEELLAPAREAEARGDLDAALRALSDIPEPGRAAADALAAELEPRIEAVAGFLEDFAKARTAVAEDLRPAWAAEIPLPRMLDPERCAVYRKAAAGLTGETDPLRNLQRIWMLYHYGRTTTDFAALSALEEKVRAFLAADRKAESAAIDAVLAQAKDAKLDDAFVLEVARRAPWLGPPPGPGRIEFPHPTRASHHAFVQFPDSYGPWKRTPLYVSHHGQGSSADAEFEFLTQGRRAPVLEHGMAIVCPEYGSINGVGRAQEDDLDTLALLAWLRLNANVDPDRIYVTGSSMGGAQSWHLTETYPDQWGAGAPDNRAPSFPLTLPTLRNLVSLPIYHMQGAFNGKSNAISREAIAKLTSWQADLVYREFGLFGHDSSLPYYPEMIRWLLRRARPASPAEVYLGAVKSFAAERAWLRIRSLAHPTAWSRPDSSYAPSDLVCLTARIKNGAIELDLDLQNRRRIKELEISLDDVLLGGATEVPIVHNKKTVATWHPERSVRRALEEMKRRGDRERGYAASVLLEVDEAGFRVKGGK